MILCFSSNLSKDTTKNKIKTAVKKWSVDDKAGLCFLNCLETTELSVESLTITASASKDLFLNLLIYSQNSIHF